MFIFVPILLFSFVGKSAFAADARDFVGNWSFDKPEPRGSWGKSVSGKLKIALNSNGLLAINLSIDNRHLCSVEGLARFASGKVTFNTDEPIENNESASAEKGHPCKLELTIQKNILTIKQVSPLLEEELGYGCRAQCGESGPGFDFTFEQRRPPSKGAKNSSENVPAGISSNSNHKEYEGLDFDHLYQKDRSFQSLDGNFTALCDGILTSSKKNRTLSPREERLVTNYVRQNNLFKQPGFNGAWLTHTRQALTSLTEIENNRIAAALFKKVEALYHEQNP